MGGGPVSKGGSWGWGLELARKVKLRMLATLQVEVQAELELELEWVLADCEAVCRDSGVAFVKCAEEFDWRCREMAVRCWWRK